MSYSYDFADGRSGRKFSGEDPWVEPAPMSEADLADVRQIAATERGRRAAMEPLSSDDTRMVQGMDPDTWEWIGPVAASSLPSSEWRYASGGSGVIRVADGAILEW